VIPVETLHPQWESRVRRNAGLFSLLVFVALSVTALAIFAGADRALVTLPLCALIAYGAYAALTRKIQRRRRILAQPFPREWEAVLLRDVAFFRALPEEGKARFRRDLQIFLGEKRISGIRTEIDATTRVLVGASAVIPIFGHPDWEWDQVSEILVYPTRFKSDFSIGEGSDHATLGMVGTGVMNRIMILSKPDLIQGYRNPEDKLNVGIHEFAHLLDKTDGETDGIPMVGLDRRTVAPWIELVRRKTQEIEDRESDLRPYALTNQAEFFAVAAEYFFERPELMKRKHPELHAMLTQIFNQRPRVALKTFSKGRRQKKKLGRNSPCPCGSGNKFKKCCLG